MYNLVALQAGARNGRSKLLYKEEMENMHKTYAKRINSDFMLKLYIVWSASFESYFTLSLLILLDRPFFFKLKVDETCCARNESFKFVITIGLD